MRARTLCFDYFAASTTETSSSKNTQEYRRPPESRIALGSGRRNASSLLSSRGTAALESQFATELHARRRVPESSLGAGCLRAGWDARHRRSCLGLISVGGEQQTISSRAPSVRQKKREKNALDCEKWREPFRSQYPALSKTKWVRPETKILKCCPFRALRA